MKKLGLASRILVGLLIGVVVGLILQPFPKVAQTYIKPFGDLFLNLIRMIIVPLVLASLVVGTASVENIRKLGRVGAKTIAYYLFTTALAVIIGLIMGNLMQPGSGLTLPTDAQVTAAKPPSLVSVLLNMVPTNPIKAMVDANMLQIIVFSIFLGIAITLVGERAKVVFNFFDGLAEASYKIVRIIMWYAPIGVFALIVPTVATHGAKVLLPLLKLIIALYIGLAIHAGVVYSLLVKTMGKMNPGEFFKKAAPAMLVAFTTCSSSATLPVTMDVAEKELNVPKSISSFTLPLGATINMDGTALYQGICALFVAQIFGISLSFSQQLAIVLTATLASIGTAGVPGAGLIMLTMVFTSVGLPMEGIALIAGVDRILDMGRTCLNVTGDMVGTLIIHRSEKA
ncbi:MULTISPECIES: dicarboxylate/amino acid:cation symporter [Pseudothermotoga]|uniref:dicarboxylate/amino acid:cation symporter n=1 Tax=Pseudothermotoga TaxID=1643951 RepID=UPI000428C5FB|nr:MULTISPECIES: dicarboxylate/amino acid:cation symporter [Pseudothermotoga]MDI6861920.1 dicarboxylate/amino acid:cation symporter [Pseudothermotoga sp.]